MSEPYVGEIRIFPYQFAPQGWLYCAGQTVTIQEYQILYAVIGITYGGDGRTNFKLPDLRGEAVMGTGTGPGLTTRALSQKVGANTVTLLESQIPSHTHVMQSEISQEVNTNPSGLYPGATKVVGTTKVQYYKGTATADAAFDSSMIGSAGQSAAHNNQQPFLCSGFCIATDGIYPSPD